MAYNSSQIRNKELWYNIICDRGLNYCHKCGYNKHFGAIDLHHIGRVGTWNNRNVRLSALFLLPPTSERLKQLDNCISLCATCHRELHIEEGTVGKPLGVDLCSEEADQMIMEWQ